MRNVTRENIRIQTGKASGFLYGGLKQLIKSTKGFTKFKVEGYSFSNGSFGEQTYKFTPSNAYFSKVKAGADALVPHLSFSPQLAEGSLTVVGGGLATIAGEAFGIAEDLYTFTDGYAVSINGIKTVLNTESRSTAQSADSGIGRDSPVVEDAAAADSKDSDSDDGAASEENDKFARLRRYHLLINLEHCLYNRDKQYQGFLRVVAHQNISEDLSYAQVQGLYSEYRKKEFRRAVRKHISNVLLGIAGTIAIVMDVPLAFLIVMGVLASVLMIGGSIISGRNHNDADVGHDYEQNLREAEDLLRKKRGYHFVCEDTINALKADEKHIRQLRQLAALQESFGTDKEAEILADLQKLNKAQLLPMVKHYLECVERNDEEAINNAKYAIQNMPIGEVSQQALQNMLTKYNPVAMAGREFRYIPKKAIEFLMPKFGALAIFAILASALAPVMSTTALAITLVLIMVPAELYVLKPAYEAFKNFAADTVYKLAVNFKLEIPLKLVMGRDFVHAQALKQHEGFYAGVYDLAVLTGRAENIERSQPSA